MGLGQELSQFFTARGEAGQGRAGQRSLAWAQKISPKIPKFVNFFRFRSKKSFRLGSKSTRFKDGSASKVSWGWVKPGQGLSLFHTCIYNLLYFLSNVTLFLMQMFISFTFPQKVISSYFVPSFLSLQIMVYCINDGFRKQQIWFTRLAIKDPFIHLYSL